MKAALILLMLGIILGITCPAGTIKIYQWTDEYGVVHSVDEPDKVPLECRQSAQVIDTEGSELKTRAKDMLTKVIPNQYGNLSGCRSARADIFSEKAALRYKIEAKKDRQRKAPERL